MLDYADKLTRTPGLMRESDVIALRAHGLGDRDILDVNQVVAYFAYVNRVADGLGVTIDDYADVEYAAIETAVIETAVIETAANEAPSAIELSSSSLVRTLSKADAPLLTQPFYVGGDPGPITASMAHVPELVEVALPFIGAVLSPSAIDWRTKEIVIVRTSALMQCRYCIDSHTPVAIDSGLSHAQVHALRDEQSIASAFTDERDLVLIEWTDAVATGPGAVPVNAARNAARLFTEAEIVELTLLVGVTLLLNRYATSLGLPVDPSTIERLAREGFQRS